MSPTEPPDGSDTPGPPEESDPAERNREWKPVAPAKDWREPERRSLLSRYPALGFALIGIVAAGALLAFRAAVRSREADPPAAAAGGVLRVGITGVPSLDPADARDPRAVMVVDQIFDTLVTYDGETSEPRAGLARAFEANAEQTVFTFRMAPEARFHDGSPVSASDVKFTLERIAAKGSKSPLVAQLDAIRGFEAYHNGTAPGLAGVEAPNPATIVVHLDRPFSSFPAVLGHPGFGVVPKAAVEQLGDRFKEAPVGSGPFRVTGPAAGGRLHLERVAGRQPAPLLDGIDFVDFPDVDAAYRSFRSGDLDLAPVPPAEMGDAATRYGRRGMGPYLGLFFYGMNVKSPELADPRLRQALTLAVDRRRIVDKVYPETLDVATGLVADGVRGRAPDACGERCRHDPARAKALVAEAFPDGGVPQVAIDHDDDPTQTAVAASIKADLDVVGIPSVLRPHAFADYGQFLVSGQQGLFRLGWIADYPSPDGFLTPLFLSTSPDNLTGLANPGVDAALLAARAEADPEKRQEIYRDAEQRVLEQYVVVPVAQLQTRMVVSEQVQSFTLGPIGTFDGAAVSLATK